MHWFFWVFRFYPVAVLALLLVLAQVGLHLRRRNSSRRYFVFILMFLLAASAGVWLFYRGDLHADQWLKTFLDYQI